MILVNPNYYIYLKINKPAIISFPYPVPGPDDLTLSGSGRYNNTE